MTKANGREDNGVASLCRKRAELVSAIGEKEAELQTLVLQLNHIDAALNIMRPEIATPGLPPSHVRPRRPTKRGAVSRPILAALHEARQPLTVKDMARAYLIAQGKPAQRVSEDARESVRRIIRLMQRQGVVRAVGMDGPAQIWELVRE